MTPNSADSPTATAEATGARVERPAVHADSGGPARFDAPVLAGGDTLRVIARTDANAERRRHDMGYRAGYDDGYARGAADVDAAIGDHRRNAERLDSLCSALEKAVDALRTNDRENVAEIESAVVELSVEIAEAVIGREIANGDVVIESLRRSLALVPSDQPPVVRVHPDDAGVAAEALEAGLVSASPDIELVGDPSIERGGTVVDCGPAHIDGQIGPALARIRATLGGDLLAHGGNPAQSGS
ncbi:MAG: FliH/SctL family protein [Actinomycetota bacterium]